MRHFHKEDFIAKYGLLYAKYKSSSWYWEYIIFAKRFVTVGGVMLFSRTPLFALILVENVAETCNLCVQFVVCTCLIVLCVQQYLYQDIAIPTHDIVQGWTVTLSVASILFGICAMVAALAKDQ